jgi:hypothetical protein
MSVIHITAMLLGLIFTTAVIVWLVWKSSDEPPSPWTRVT